MTLGTTLEFDAAQMATRLGAAVVLGGIIGLNRDLHGKPAGLRTHATVALGAAMVTLISMLLLSTPGSDAGAVTRTIQGIVTGVGFIGGGVILHRSDPIGVHGLTTAATVWVAASLGIACGAGQFVLAAIATGLMLMVLIVGGPIERVLHRLIKGKALPASADGD